MSEAIAAAAVIPSTETVVRIERGLDNTGEDDDDEEARRKSRMNADDFGPRMLTQMNKEQQEALANLQEIRIKLAIIRGMQQPKDVREEWMTALPSLTQKDKQSMGAKIAALAAGGDKGELVTYTT